MGGGHALTMKRLKRRLSAAFYRSMNGSTGPILDSNIVNHAQSHGAVMLDPDGDTQLSSRRAHSSLTLSGMSCEGSIPELSEPVVVDKQHPNGYVATNGFNTIDEERVWTRGNNSSKSASGNLNSHRLAHTLNTPSWIDGVDGSSNHCLHESRSCQSRLNRAVVQEHPGIGSDGESEDASGTSDDVVSSPGNLLPDGVSGCSQYVSSNNVHVRMRQKPTRRYSEQDIQKRLSLPADLRLPLSVVEKLNRTPTLDQPLTRKNRRTSLSEIGFGKIESYQKLEKLGEGTYATVYKGRSRLTDGMVALKEIRLEHEEGAPCTAIREVSLLRDLKHSNVVTLHDIIHTEKTLTLVFEYLDRDLKQYMDECGNILSMNNVRIFLFQLVRGLEYCHQRRVLHRDLKPQNLLINARGELKLADFGLARAKSVPTKTYSNEVVTLWYRPPDVLLGSTDYSTQIDMWGVGCILYEMAAGRPFFPGSTVDEQLHIIFRALGTPTQEQYPELFASKEFHSYSFPSYHAEPLVNHAPRLDIDGLDILAQLLQYEGKKRLSARDALIHGFFNSLGPLVHRLPDTESIFAVPGIVLTRDPGYRSNHHHHHHYQHGGNKNRRQSMLL